MNGKIANTALAITIITLLSKIVGFTRDVLLATSYGTTMQSDAFIMAQSIINVATSLILAALSTTIIPILSEYTIQKTREVTNRFLNIVYTIVISLTIIICFFGMMYTNELVGIFAPNFSPATKLSTVELTWLMLPSVVLTAIITLNSANLQNHGNFLIPASIGFPLNFSMIFYMLFFADSFGINGLAISVIVGTALQILLQLPFSRKMGYHFRIIFDIRDEGIKRIGILIVPILIGTGIQQINTMVDRMLASGLAEGSVAALTFSSRLGLFITGLLSAAVVSIFYTSMSKYYSSGSELLFKKLLKNTINVSNILIIPASIDFIILRTPIVQAIYERGMFANNATKMTAAALLYYTIGLVGFLLRDVVSRAFYAIKDTKTAMINGSIAVFLNIFFSLILVRYMGIGGLALGTSISGIVGTVLLTISLYRKIGDFGIKGILVTFCKVLAVSLIMGVIVHYCYEFLTYLKVIKFISITISLFISGMVYFLAIWLLKIEEFNIVRNQIRSSMRIRNEN